MHCLRETSTLALSLAENQGFFGQAEVSRKTAVLLEDRTLLLAAAQKSLFLSKPVSFTRLPIWIAGNLGLSLSHSPGGRF